MNTAQKGITNRFLLLAGLLFSACLAFPTFAQDPLLKEQALTAHTTAEAIPARAMTGSTSAMTAEPMLLSPDADLQKALQRMIDYPDLAWDLGIDGTGHVEIRIDTAGRVVEASVIEGWGFGLDEEVLTAVRRLGFTPGYSGARPVEVVTQFPLTLTLP
jgi:TonB family protein